MGVDPEEIDLDWLDDPVPGEKERPPKGKYVWCVKVLTCAFKNQETEKPFGQLGCVVVEGDYAGYKFDYRLYISKAARNWATYFLKKFEYPPELLSGEKPILRRTAIEGLEGKMLAEVAEHPQYGWQVDVKGFDYYLGVELEARVAKEQEIPLTAAEEEPSVDLEADIKEPVADADLSFLDREPGDEVENSEGTS